jgi:hypothetical protein
MNTKMKIKIEIFLFVAGLLLFILSGVFAKYIFKLISVITQKENNVVYSPLENPIIKLTELLVFIAFFLILSSGISVVLKFLRKRTDGK